MKLFSSIKKAIKNRRLEIYFFKNHHSLYRQELDAYRNAREAWYDPYTPTTWDMQEVYREAVKNDAHLRALINTRIHLVLSNEFALYLNEKRVDNGLLKTPWFRKKLRFDLESQFYGYSLMYPVVHNGKIIDIKPIERGYFVPQKNYLLQDPYHREGMQIDGLEKYIWKTEIGNDCFGLLETAAPLTILKRHSWSAWDEFEQVFGIPIRIATVSGSDQEKMNVLEALIGSRKSSVGVVGPNTNIEVKDSNQSDAHKVFSEKILLVNKELSKLLLGQTMTTDDGSSNAQSETHFKMQTAIIKEDTIQLLSHINAFLPVLRSWGYDLPKKAEARIVPAAQTLQERIAIDSVLLQAGVSLDKSYLEETYNIKVSKSPTERKVPTANIAAINEIDTYYNLIK